MEKEMLPLAPRSGYKPTSEEAREWKRCNDIMDARYDMYAALKAIEADCPCDRDINPKFNRAWQMLLDAIAKAEGR